MDFIEWLTDKIRTGGLSYSELARRGGMSHARISQVMAGETPGADFCVKLARALGESPEYVLRLAGILDPLPEQPSGPTVEDMVRDLWLAQQRQQPALRERPESYLPGQGVNIDRISKMLAQLDSGRLELAAIFIRWLLDQPGWPRGGWPPPPKRERTPGERRLIEALTAMDDDEIEMFVSNALRLWEAGKLETGEDNHSQPYPPPPQNQNQGRPP